MENNTFYYNWQMPEHFRWIRQTSEWKRRQKNIRAICRVQNIKFVAQLELYYLRILS